MHQLDTDGRYQLDQQEHEQIANIFAADFCSDDEGKQYIRQAFEQGYLMDPHTATCFKTCRSAEFKDQVNIIYSTAEWTKFASVIDNAINANEPDSDQAALQSVSAAAGIKVPEVIARLFDKPVAHPGVVEKQAIEAEILKFLGAGN